MNQIASESNLTRLGPYAILGKIDESGKGTVYKAADAVTGQPVAIKVVSEAVVADPVMRMRFARECQVARKLAHPHIVRVMDFGLDGSKPFLVMEYVDGGSVGQHLERVGRLPQTDAIRLIVQVGQALHWAHQRGLIHRDIQPNNILLTAGGQGKLAGLGIAKNLEDGFNLTKSVSFLGTPYFIAPEQFENPKRADALSDLYALGATLYMMVTGEPPFQASSARELGIIYKKKLNNDITAPGQLVPELSERLEAAILKALRANRKERPQSVLEFLDSLTAEPAAATTTPPAPVPQAAPVGPVRLATSQRQEPPARSSGWAGFLAVCTCAVVGALTGGAIGGFRPGKHGGEIGSVAGVIAGAGISKVLGSWRKKT